MSKIIRYALYAIGGIFAFFVLIVIIVPSSPPSVDTKSAEEQGSVDAKTDELSPTDATSVEVQNQPVSTPKVAEPESSTQPIKQNPTPDTPPQSSSQYTYYAVTSVVDGDTIKVNISGTVTTLRLIGLDTPETVDPRKPVQCFGKEASNKTKELLSGKKVRIEMDSTQGELDKYGRTLAYIYRDDGLFFNKAMIEQGYAHEYTYSSPYKYQAEFKAAEKYARENQLGLWSLNTCNGDTTQAANSGSSSSGSTNSPQVQTGTKYYTSSHYSAKYYYPEDCSGWKSLSPSYLKSFDSLEDLLKSYPSRALSPQC